MLICLISERLRAAGGSVSSSSVSHYSRKYFVMTLHWFLKYFCILILQKESANQNPFIINPHGNPAFHPQKLTKNAVNFVSVIFYVHFLPIFLSFAVINLNFFLYRTILEDLNLRNLQKNLLCRTCGTVVKCGIR